MWEAFEESQGHGVWGRYAWCEDDAKIAFITLYKYAVRGVHYLWAKWGPAWVKEASPEREAALRALDGVGCADLGRVRGAAGAHAFLLGSLPGDGSGRA